jgi:DNA mismatch repair protein MutS
VVSYLKNNQPVLKNIKIKSNFRFRTFDFKIAAGKVSPREVVYLKESLDAIIPIKTLALESPQEA